jgi:hypothetical protein
VEGKMIGGDNEGGDGATSLPTDAGVGSQKRSHSSEGGGPRKQKKEEAGGAAAATAPEGIGNLDHYHIDWSIRTEGSDPEHGGHDFKRSRVTGKLVFTTPSKLVFSAEALEEECETEVAGSICMTQYRMHYMCNNGINKFQIFDETQEGMEVYQSVVEGLEDSCDDVAQGDIQVIERVVTDPAHRGHGLGLFMIEAADTVINGHMSAQILKPFPLQFERSGTKKDYYGFPEPPGGPTEEREAALAAAQAKIGAHYGRLGFKRVGETGFMLRWNGFQQPSLDQARRS